MKITRNIAALDIGGTNARIMIYNKDMKELFHTKFDTDPNNPQYTLDKLIEIILQHDVEVISGSVPGPADYKKGVLKDLPNLPGWRELHIKDYFVQKTNVNHVYFANDAKLMALAHHKDNKASNDDVTQFFTLSTGVGAGLIVNGEIYEGAFGRSMEVAYLPVAWNRESGKGLGEGAVEYFTSGSGLLERSKKHTNIDSVQGLFDQAKQGNDSAKKIIDEGCEALANLIATTGSLINPSLMVFDGSIARHQRWYVDKAIEIAKNRMYPQQFKDIKFVYGKLGDNAGLQGAYEFALINFEKEE